MPAHRRILERRRKLQLTQEELAERLHNLGQAGLDATIISKIERGVRALKADELPFFAAALECDVADLLDVK
jgi:transcriptional regulator with XRE-family HTH domain